MSVPGPLVRVERHGSVALVIRDNPPVNALTLGLSQQLSSAFTDLAGDDTINAVVLTGAGEKSFGAGSDITEFEPLMDEGSVIEKKMAFENRMLTFLAQMEKPTIAALNGSAFGGGLEIALACDLIVAEEGQLVGLPEVKLGLFPGSGGAVRAMRRIGEARSKELILFGDPISTETAYQWGLINAVVSRGQAIATALQWADRLAAGSASGVRACKVAVNAALGGAQDEQAIIDSMDGFRAAFHHPDAREGARAFVAKRAPLFPSAAARDRA